MALSGESVNDAQTTCHECGTGLTIDIRKSAALFYAGFFCSICGAYKRDDGLAFMEKVYRPSQNHQGQEEGGRGNSGKSDPKCTPKRKTGIVLIPIIL